MSKVAKATMGLMIVTILSKTLGFGRELVLGATYGTSVYSDVYITAMNIPSVIFSAIGAALATTFIPLYYENNNIGGNKKALEFSNNIFNIVIMIGVILAILGFIFAKVLVKIFAMGFEGEVLHSAVQFTKIMIFGGIFIGMSNIMASILQIKGNFIIPGLIGIPFNIIIIISIILSIKINIYILPVGTLVAMVSQFLFQLHFAIKHGYRYHPLIKINDEYVKKMIWLVAPVFIGVCANQVNVMVDRTLASTLAEGSISALNYANRLNGFVMGIFISTLGSVVYPMLSKLSLDNNKENFSEIVVRSINSIILLVVPISVGAIVLATPIVKLLFQRGAFDIKATSMTAEALVFYSIGMIGFSLRDILGKVFYSLKDTKTPMINGGFAIVINIILNIILVKSMGHAGLAFATSLSALICIVLLFISLRKKIGYFGQGKIINTTLKSLIAAIFMGVSTAFLYKVLAVLLSKGFISDIIVLFTSVGIGAIIYAILVVLFKVEEVDIVIDIVRNKLNKFRNLN